MTPTQALGRAFRSVEPTDGFVPVTVEGALPDGLAGTLWRNGPGLFELFGRPYRHWFDADGAITALRIADGRAQVASAVVECPKLAEERAAGRPLYASGQTRTAWWRMVGGRGKAVRNINVLRWQGETFALAEGGLPIPIDEHLGSGAPRALVPDQPSFHAHSRVDPKTGALYGFGIEYGRVCHLSVYRLEPGGGARIARMPLPGPRVLVHDIAFAGDAVIVMVHPLDIRVVPLMLGLRSPLESLVWRPEQGTEVFVVPLAAPEATRRFTIPAFYSFHFGNAFADGDAYVVDLCRMPRLDLDAEFSLASMRRGEVPEMPPSRFTRVTLRGESAEVEELVGGERDFPVADARLAGRRHRYTWIIEDDAGINRLARFDHETGACVRAALGDGIHCGEVSVAPRGEAEDDVWIMAQVHDFEADRVGAVVLDGADPTRPPLARLWYPHHVPPALHGCFAPRG